MQLIKIITFATAAALGQQLHAQDNCGAIENVTRLHVALEQIASPRMAVVDPQAMPTVLMMVDRLDRANVIWALRDGQTNDETETIRTFMTTASVVGALISSGNAETLRAYVASPDIMPNLSAMQHVIERRKCVMGVVTARDLAPQDKLAGFASQAIPTQSRGIGTYTIAAAAVATIVAIVLAIVGLVRYRLRKLRRGRRHLVNLPLSFRLDNLEIDGQLLDISLGGAKIRHGFDKPTMAGNSIEINLLGQWHTATLTWSNVHYAGLSFETRLKQRKLRQILDQTTKAKPPTGIGQTKTAPV